MSEKVVALNSGGFDSVCMLYRLKDIYPDYEVHCIHFNYGQNNAREEARCAKAICSKLGYKYVCIDLPHFKWTKSKFFTPTFESPETQELEYRNLIFLSYALSYAESIQAGFIYAAILRSLGYKDTSEDFCKCFDMICALSGIEFVTPFSQYDKMDLMRYVFKYDIKPDEFFSCDVPVHGKPCGKCDDCLTIQDIMKGAIANTPFLQFCKMRNTKDSLFQGLFFCNGISEARLYTNNKCQLHCEHCYYGFDEMKSDPLTYSEWVNVIDQCVKFGIKNFHFSGKEPLADDMIFRLAAYIKASYPECKYDLVTNGLNVKAFADRLQELGFSRVCLSFSPGEIRAHQSFDAIHDCGLPVTAFIDVQSGIEYKEHEGLDDILETLYEDFDVKDFYIRFILPIGHAEELPLMTEEEIFKAIQTVDKFSQYALDAQFVVSVPNVYAEMVKNSRIFYLQDIYQNALDFGIERITENFKVSLEVYCTRYEEQITITADGYVLGCASETSCADYYCKSVGNVRDKSIPELVRNGKQIAINDNEKLMYTDFTKCAFDL